MHCKCCALAMSRAQTHRIRLFMLACIQAYSRVAVCGECREARSSAADSSLSTAHCLFFGSAVCGECREARSSAANSSLHGVLLVPVWRHMRRMPRSEKQRSEFELEHGSLSFLRLSCMRRMPRSEKQRSEFELAGSFALHFTLKIDWRNLLSNLFSICRKMSYQQNYSCFSQYYLENTRMFFPIPNFRFPKESIFIISLSCRQIFSFPEKTERLLDLYHQLMVLIFS